MNASRYGVGRLVVFLCAAGALADTSEHLYAPDGSFYAALPHAAEPFRSDETSLAWLQSRPGLVETETDVGFDTRAVSIRQYLKSDSTKSLDSLVLWEAYYPELSDYLNDAMLQKRRDLFWDEMTRRAAKDTSSQPMRFELPVKVPEWAKKLGIDKPNLSLTGDYKFRIKSSSHWTNIDEDNGTANKVPNFEPDQEPNVNLVGSIGKLIHVQLSWTKDGFGVSNNQMLQIKYAGEKPEDTEDDILQEAEFGYINFALSGTSLTGYTEQASGLIGAKAKMKFGDLDATVIVGGEKGEKQHQKLGAGSTNNTQTIDDRSPAQGAFFLDQAYRTEFDNVAGNYSAMTVVDGVRLFVRVSATDAKNNPSWAPFWKGSAQGYDAGGASDRFCHQVGRDLGGIADQRLYHARRRGVPEQYDACQHRLQYDLRSLGSHLQARGRDCPRRNERWKAQPRAAFAPDGSCRNSFVDAAQPLQDALLVGVGQ